jgi:hypothetical protein
LRELGANAMAKERQELEALTRTQFQYNEAIDDWEEKTKEAIGRMDEFRSSAKGILSGFIEGGPKGAIEALQSRLTQLGEDMLISGLFGEQGKAGGGLFGGLVQDLLGGMPEKPVATMNVVAGVVNVGGAMPGGVGAIAPLASGAGTPGWTSPVSVGTAGELIQAQSDAGTRTMGLNVAMQRILQQAAAATGLTAIVESGGQAALGSGGPRVGSTRHDLGAAADLDLRDPATGRLLNMNNPADVVRMEAFLRESRAAGATGIGAGPGYMGGTTRMHVGLGTPAYWGAGGSAANAPDWVRRAYEQGGAMPGASPPLATAAATAAPAVDELTSSINALKAPVDAAVPALGQLANTILNFAPSGTAISSQAASAITSGFGGLFQHGGELGAGKWGIAGEHGPELIHGPASVTPVHSGARSPRFNVNIKTQEGVTARVTRAEQNDNGEFDLEVFATAIEHNIRDKYGLRQSPSRWGRAA